MDNHNARGIVKRFYLDPPAFDLEARLYQRSEALNSEIVLVVVVAVLRRSHWHRCYQMFRRNGGNKVGGVFQVLNDLQSHAAIKVYRRPNIGRKHSEIQIGRASRRE